MLPKSEVDDATLVGESEVRQSTELPASGNDVPQASEDLGDAEDALDISGVSEDGLVVPIDVAEEVFFNIRNMLRDQEED